MPPPDKAQIPFPTPFRINTGGDGQVDITGKLTSGKLSAGNDLNVSAGGGIFTSEIAPDGNLAVSSGADIVGSLISSKENALDEVIAAGKITGSTLHSTTGFKVTAGKEISKSLFQSGSAMTVTANSFVSTTRFISGDNITADVTGAIKASRFLPANDLILTAHSSVIGSRFETLDGLADITISGILGTSTIDSSASVDLTILSAGISTVKITAGLDATVTSAGNLVASIVAARDVTVTSDGTLPGSVAGSLIGKVDAAGDVTLDIGSLGPRAKPLAPGAKIPEPMALPPILPNRITSGGDLSLHTTERVHLALIEVGGDVVDFQIGTELNGIVRVHGDFVVGNNVDPVNIISGVTSRPSLIDIDGDLGDTNSSPSVRVIKNFQGRLTVGGQLATELKFGANVSRLVVEGGIGPATVGIAHIIVAGNLGSLSSGSLYQSIDAHNGNFVDGAGVPTGSLNVTGTIGSVTPEVF